MNREGLKQVQNLKYLEIIIRKPLLTNIKLNNNIKLRKIKSYICPKLLCGIESWTLLPGIPKKLESHEM